MATNQMSQDQKDSIKKEVDNLLARGYAFYKFPLRTREERLKVLLSRVDPRLVEAHALLKDNGYSMQQISGVSISYIPAGGMKEQINILHSDADPPEYFPAHPAYRDYAKKPFTEEEVAKVLSPERAHDISMWATDARRYWKEAIAAQKAVAGVLKITNTGGQLRRMFPELIDWLSPNLKKKVSEQKRASSLPYEWAGMARPPVYAASALLSKCYLLPPASASDTSEYPSGYTWLA